MFAVILLGIGFIMVAAMFPIAIQQSRSSTEETSASVIARAAIAHLSEVATDSTMPSSAGKPSTNEKFWDAIRGAAINESDPRYAWVALYSRKPSEQTAQVYVFVLQSRNRPVFNLNDVTPLESPDGTVVPASIAPKPVYVRQAYDGDTPLRVLEIHDDNGVAMSAAEGAYIILADHDLGRLLRLGRTRNRADGFWELAPGNDQFKTIPRDQVVPGYMIGRGYHPDTPNPLTAPPQYEGSAMDIAAFIGFVRVK